MSGVIFQPQTLLIRTNYGFRRFFTIRSVEMRASDMPSMYDLIVHEFMLGLSGESTSLDRAHTLCQVFCCDYGQAIIDEIYNALQRGLPGVDIRSTLGMDRQEEQAVQEHRENLAAQPRDGDRVIDLQEHEESPEADAPGLIEGLPPDVERRHVRSGPGGTRVQNTRVTSRVPRRFG